MTFRAPSATVGVEIVSVDMTAHVTAVQVAHLHAHRHRRLMYQLLQLLYLCQLMAGVSGHTANDQVLCQDRRSWWFLLPKTTRRKC